VKNRGAENGRQEAVKNSLLLLLLASTLPTLHGQDFKLSASEKGVLINASSAGPFIWPAPKLRMSETVYQGVEATIRKEQNNTVAAAYPGGPHHQAHDFKSGCFRMGTPVSDANPDPISQWWAIRG